MRRDAGAGWKSITASTGELRWRPAEYRPPLPGGTELPERVSCIFSYGHCDSGVEIVSHTGFFLGCFLYRSSRGGANGRARRGGAPTRFDAPSSVPVNQAARRGGSDTGLLAGYRLPLRRAFFPPNKKKNANSTGTSAPTPPPPPLSSSSITPGAPSRDHKSSGARFKKWIRLFSWFE